jgi:polyisoprenoid-binding protein YceI
MSTQTTETVTLSGDYDVDAAHSRFGFAAKHAMVTTVRGAFKEFTAEIHVDEADPTKSTAKVEIQTASIDTGNQMRDDHVRNSDFLEVENYPTITFASTKVEKIDDENFKVTGDLTVKDVTKPVSINLELTGAADDPWGNFRLGFEGKAEINRSDYGVTFNMPLGGGVVISEKVKLEFDIAAVRRKAE